MPCFSFAKKNKNKNKNKISYIDATEDIKKEKNLTNIFKRKMTHMNNMFNNDKLFIDGCKTNRKFLICDDVFANRLVLQKLLESNGHKCFLAENGKVVIDYVTRYGTFDIIWLDLQMPVMNGLKCANILRNKFLYKGVIVGLTGFIDNESVNKCLNSGMNCVITKPVDHKTITDCIDKYLKKN